jgi:hypothetical protein
MIKNTAKGTNSLINFNVVESSQMINCVEKMGFQIVSVKFIFSDYNVGDSFLGCQQCDTA